MVTPDDVSPRIIKRNREIFKFNFGKICCLVSIRRRRSYVHCTVCKLHGVYTALCVNCKLRTMQVRYTASYVHCKLGTLQFVYTASYVHCKLCTLQVMYTAS